MNDSNGFEVYELEEEIYYFTLSDNDRLNSWKKTLYPDQYLNRFELEDLEHSVFHCS
jgi:hypothetical protein